MQAAKQEDEDLDALLAELDGPRPAAAAASASGEGGGAAPAADAEASAEAAAAEEGGAEEAGADAAVRGPLPALHAADLSFRHVSCAQDACHGSVHHTCSGVCCVV